MVIHRVNPEVTRERSEGAKATYLRTTGTGWSGAGTRFPPTLATIERERVVLWISYG